MQYITKKYSLTSYYLLTELNVDMYVCVHILCIILLFDAKKDNNNIIILLYHYY
jgi:hypothetical protein